MDRTRAEALALSALAFIASDDRRLALFLGASGMDGSAIRRTVADAAALAGVLDFLLHDEALLLEFCADAGIPPVTPGRARRFLPGAAPDL